MIAEWLAQHPRWPLFRARVAHVDETLLTSVGLPEPSGEPLVHFSPGVDVRISRPHAAFGARPGGRG